MKSLVGLSILIVGTIASFTHHVLYFSVHSSTILALTSSFIAPSLVLWATISVVAYYHLTEAEDGFLGRIAMWYVGAGLVFGLAIYGTIHGHLTVGSPSSGVQLSVANWTIGGSFIGILLGFYDARQNRAIRLAKIGQEEASRNARRLSVMNRVLRHDMRNKLTIIVGHAELLRSQGADESAAAIKDSAEELIDIAERMRNLHIVTDNRTRQSVHLAEIIDEIVTDIQDTYPQIQLISTVNDQSTAFTYPAIEDNIYDLIENAIIHNHHDEPDIEIEIELRQVCPQNEPLVELIIADNGPGIPPFEEVILGEEGETQLDHSLGTGLWLTRWIVEESEGTFNFSTPPDGGTEVQIRLPTPP